MNKLDDMFSSLNVLVCQCHLALGWDLVFPHWINEEKNIYRLYLKNYYIVNDKMEDYLKNRSEFYYYSLILFTNSDLSDEQRQKTENYLDHLTDQVKHFVNKIEEVKEPQSIWCS